MRWKDCPRLGRDAPEITTELPTYIETTAKTRSYDEYVAIGKTSEGFEQQFIVVRLKDKQLSIQELIKQDSKLKDYLDTHKLEDVVLYKVNQTTMFEKIGTLENVLGS